MEKTKADEKKILDYILDNSNSEIHENIKNNFEKTEIHQFAGDRAYVDDVVLDHTCPYKVRAVSKMLNM